MLYSATLYLMPYYTYILRCADNSLYTGKTTDIKKRLRQHNGEIKGGAKYTAAKRPVTLCYYEAFTTHKEAAQKEYALKKLSHQEKEHIIEKKSF